MNNYIRLGIGGIFGLLLVSIGGHTINTWQYWGLLIPTTILFLIIEVLS